MDKKITKKNADLIRRIMKYCGVSFAYFNSNDGWSIAGAPKRGGGAGALLDFIRALTDDQFYLDTRMTSIREMSDIVVVRQPSDDADSEAILASCKSNLALLQNEAGDAAWSIIAAYLNREQLQKELDTTILGADCLAIATARLKFICADAKTNPAKVYAGSDEEGTLLFVHRNAGPTILKNVRPGESAPFVWEGTEGWKKKRE